MALAIQSSSKIFDGFPRTEFTWIKNNIRSQHAASSSIFLHSIGSIYNSRKTLQFFSSRNLIAPVSNFRQHRGKQRNRARAWICIARRADCIARTRYFDNTNQFSFKHRQRIYAYFLSPYASIQIFWIVQNNTIIYNIIMKVLRDKTIFKLFLGDFNYTFIRGTISNIIDIVYFRINRRIRGWTFSTLINVIRIQHNHSPVINYGKRGSNKFGIALIYGRLPNIVRINDCRRPSIAFKQTSWNSKRSLIERICNKEIHSITPNQTRTTIHKPFIVRIGDDKMPPICPNKASCFINFFTHRRSVKATINS